MGFNPQETLENTANTMGTLLGGTPNCPLTDFLRRTETNCDEPPSAPYCYMRK